MHDLRRIRHRLVDIFLGHTNLIIRPHTDIRWTPPRPYMLHLTNSCIKSPFLMAKDQDVKASTSVD
jgi:hypothetical protein